MGRQEPQKCPLYAWLSFRGCPPPPPSWTLERRAPWEVGGDPHFIL